MFCFQAKKLLGADEKQLGVHERLMAGSMAGVASQTSIYPLEVKARKTTTFIALLHSADLHSATLAYICRMQTSYDTYEIVTRMTS